MKTPEKWERSDDVFLSLYSTGMTAMWAVVLWHAVLPVEQGWLVGWQVVVCTGVAVVLTALTCLGVSVRSDAKGRS